MKRLSKLLLVIIGTLVITSCAQIKQTASSLLEEYFGIIIDPSTSSSSSSSSSSSIDSSTSSSSSIVSSSSSSGIEENVYIYYVDLYDCVGDCSIISYKDTTILVDAGDEGTIAYENIKAVLDPLCPDKVIDYVIATHPDTDHYRGFFDIFENYTISTMFKYATNKTNATLTRFNNAIVSEGCTVNLITDYLAGNDTQKLVLDDKVNLEFYNTGSFLTDTDSNNSSIVFTLNAYNSRIIFSGDAESGPEAIYAPLAGDVDIYSMGHHGSNNGTSPKLLNNVKPEVVIAQVGDFLGNSYKHPTYSALSRVYTYNVNSKVYCPAGGDWSDASKDEDRNGQINVTINSTGYTITSENYQENPLEIRETTYWENTKNPYKDMYK